MLGSLRPHLANKLKGDDLYLFCVFKCYCFRIAVDLSCTSDKDMDVGWVDSKVLLPKIYFALLWKDDGKGVETRTPKEILQHPPLQSFVIYREHSKIRT